MAAGYRQKLGGSCEGKTEQIIAGRNGENRRKRVREAGK